MKVVDFHVHAFPDHVVERAVGALAQQYEMAPLTDGTIASTLELMERSGVDYSVILPVATRAAQVRSINDWAASQTDRRIICFGGIHPDYQDIPGEIDRMVSLGIPGFKIQADWQDVYVDDPRMYPIYEAAQGRLIIMFHCGEELTPFDPLRATPARLAKVHADFPDLTIIAAHMGGYRMWDEANTHLIGKNIYLDTSASFPEYLPDERFLDMIRRHGIEHILFATDLPLGDPAKDLARLHRIGLSDEELELILWKNAKRLLGDKVTSDE